MANAVAAPHLRPRFPVRTSGATIMVGLILAGLYVALGRAGMMFAMPGSVATAVWPPAGVALAGLLVFGVRIWPGVWLGSFLINLWSLAGASTTQLAGHLLPAATMATGSVAAAVISSWWLRRREREQLSSVVGVFRLLFLGGLTGSLISSIVGGLTLCVIGHAPWSHFSLLWLTWWAGDAIGVFLFAPLLLAWLEEPHLPPRAGRLESAMVGSVFIGIVSYVFLSGATTFFGSETHAFLCLPPMIWLSLRLGSRGTTTGLVLMAAIATWGTMHAWGPFGRLANLNQCLLALNSFLAVSVATCLCIVAVSWMQRRAAEELQEINRTLEIRVADRTRTLQDLADHLRDSQQRLELAVQAAKIGYWDFAPATQVAHYSPDWKEQLGLPGSTHLESHADWVNRLHPEDRARALAALTAYTAGTVDRYDQEFRLRHQNGSYRWIHSIGQFDGNPAESTARVLGCHIDITSRKETEIRWAGLARLARELNSVASVPQAARMIVELADELMPWDAAAVVMYDPQTGLSRSVLHSDIVNGERTFRLPNFTDQPPTPRLRRILEHGAEIELRQPPLESEGEQFSFGDIQRPSASLLFVPIRDGQQAIGMLSIQSYRLAAYTSKDLETLQTLADHCGGALARIRSLGLLQETESRLREAQSLAQIGSFFWHPRSGQLIWSDEMYQIYDRPRDRFAPTMAAQLAAIHPEDRARVQTAWNATAAGGPALDLDCRIINPAGQSRWLHWRARVQHNSDHETIGVEGTCQDITERTAITEDLALFRQLVDQVNDAIEVIEPITGRLLDVNTKACTALGYTRAELLTRSVSDIDPAIDPDRFQNYLRTLYQSPRGITLESRHRRKDGSLFPVEISAQLVSLGQDYIVAIVRDITERKRAETVLHEHQERLELAASAAQIGFWDWNLQTNEVKFSPEWMAQVGYAPDELPGRFETWQELLHPEDRAPMLARVTAYLEGRAPDYEVEFRLRHKDGSYRWIYTRGKLFRDEAGRPYRVLGGHVNVTERKYGEMHLRESREQLRLLFESANDAILFTTPLGHILAANQAACRLLQYGESELRQIGRAGITDPTDDRLALAIRIRNETGSYRGELTFIRKDGTRFLGEIATALMRQNDEQQIATVVIRDVTVQRRFEAEQARALSLLQATIEATNEGLLVVDREGNVTVHNQRFVEMWRLPESFHGERDDARLLGCVMEQLQDPASFLATVRRLYAHPDQESSEYLRFKDGRIFERYSRPQRSGFEILGRVWCFRDITEQRRNETAVRESEARLHLALQVTRMGSWEWNLQTNEVVSDARLTPLFAGPGDVQFVREADFFKFVHPQDRAIVTTAQQQAIQNSNHYEAVFRVIWPDQTVHWLESRGNVLRDENGRALRLAGVTADITERREAEESLRRSQQQYAELVNNIDGIVWEADAQTGRMTFVSPQAERILGYPLAEWQASATFWQDHLHPDDRTQALEFCQTRTREGEPYEFEYRMLAADGRIVWIRDLVKVTMENNRPTKLRGILLDITANKLADDMASGQSRALEMIACGAPLKETLTVLCHLVEAQLPGARCAVMLADELRNRLVFGAAPNLPAEYTRAMTDLAIGPQSACCGSAAYRRQRIIAVNIVSDPLWDRYHNLALQCQLQSCCSTPIFDPHRQVVGTLAVYYSIPRQPSPQELSVIDAATSTAAIAILKQQADRNLARSADVLRQLSANLLETQETERRHLARELHDEIGQTLTATKLLLESLQQDVAHARPAPLAPKPLQDAISHVNHLLNQVRNLSLSLRPPMLDDFGLRPALRWLLDQHTRTTGHPVTFDAANFTAKPDAALETACFRIAQEALTNISRHAQARQVTVALHNKADSFTLIVRDDGCGFDVAAAKAKALVGGSLGLLGQQERAALLGGRVEIYSELGAGTEVRIHFPLTLDEDAMLL